MNDQLDPLAIDNFFKNLTKSPAVQPVSKPAAPALVSPPVAPPPAPPVAPPRLTVVPAAPAAVAPLPAQPPAPVPASIQPAAPRIAPQIAPTPAANAIPQATQVDRDAEAKRIQEVELSRLLKQLQAGPPIPTEEEQQAAIARTQGDINALERTLKKPVTKFNAALAIAPVPAPVASAPAAAAPAPDLMNVDEIAKFSRAAEQSKLPKSAYATVQDLAAIGKEPAGPIAQAALKHLKNFGAATASLADTTIGGILPGIAGPVTYAGARMFGQSPAQAAAAEQSVVGTLDKPFGKTFGVTEAPAYKGEASREIMDFIGANIGKGAKYISEKTGIPESDVANMMGTALVGVAPTVGKVTAPVRQYLGSGVYAVTEPLVANKTVVPERARVEPNLVTPMTEAAPGPMSATQLAETQAAFAQRQAAARAAPAAPVAPPAAGAGVAPGSVGAAALPTVSTIQQALLGATPELQNAIKGISFEQTNVPTFMRHIEADSLPVPIRLTKGQANGDIVQLSNEQNRRGKDPELAQRFNEQNGLLIENINEIRGLAAPDAYGTKIIENSQGIIDAYKTIDGARSEKISAAYKALEDANGGAWPVDALAIVRNADAMLAKKLKTNFLPPGIAADLKAFREGAPMTFEQFEALRTNSAAEIRKAERSGDGNAAMASSIVREALEQLPLTGQAAIKFKPLADSARSLAKERFDMLKKDPAYKAAVDDAVSADKYLQKFVVNGVNKNIATMVNHLGKDSVAHQHMAAGTVNWLKDKAGIVDETGNFTQAGYNKALKQLDDVKNMEQIFTPDAASQLKTLGNVARYTQAQPRGAFVNNSNTLVGALAEKAKQGIGVAAEGGLNMAVPFLQLGTTVKEMRARRANEAEVRKALEIGAGTKK